jgi:beta-glucosidase
LPYVVTPLDAITAKANSSGVSVKSSLSDSDLTAAKAAAINATYAFVFLSSDSGEDSGTVEGNEGDRNNLQAWHAGDSLVNAVASVNNNTVSQVFFSSRIARHADISSSDCRCALSRSRNC